MSLSRRSYKATSSQVVNSEDLKEPIIIAMANKAREEMKALNSSSCKSMLRDSPKTLAVQLGIAELRVEGNCAYTLVIFRTSVTKSQTEISLLCNCNDNEDAVQAAPSSTKGCVNDAIWKWST